jgi:hypothetical protein
MPTPKMKRDLILKTSVTGSSCSDLNLTMDASFSTTLTGTTITYEDESSGSPDEKTKYKMVFVNGSATVGTITIKLVGNPDLSSGASLETVREGYDFDPSGTAGSVTMIASPTHSFERIWKQAVFSSTREQIVDNVAKIDIRVDAGPDVTVTQTLTTATNNQLVVSYTWQVSGGPSVSGSVTFDASTSVDSGYYTGPIRITDNDSNASSLRVEAVRKRLS